MKPQGRCNISYYLSFSILTNEQRHKLQKIFVILLDNHRKFEDDIRSKKKDDLIKKQKCKFRPDISPRSASLAKSARQKEGVLDENTPLHDYLIKKGKELTATVVILNKQKEEEELKKCTFKPYTSRKTNQIVGSNCVPVIQRLTESSPKGQI